VVDGYTDLTVIGRGASAVVYSATQVDYGREVALKVLNVDVSDRRAQKRFQRERSLNGRLSHHPNVVTVLDSGFVDGRHPYLAMELYEHGSLADRLAARGPFDVATVLRIGVRIAGALETAHRVGVLHRDVKPQNVLQSRYGEPALADFGIATILQMDESFTMALTPVHAAPELLEGSEPSVATDVYALASTLYTLVAGTAPFAGPPGEGVLAQLLRITTSELPTIARPDVPDRLVDVLRAATAKRPTERTASAAAFGAQLQSLQRELGLDVTPLPVEALDEGAAEPSGARVDQTDEPSSLTPPPPPPPTPSPPPTPTPAPTPTPSITVEPAPMPASPLAETTTDVTDPLIDATIDIEPAHQTVVGSRSFPDLPPDERPPRRWKRAVLGAGVIAAAGVATFVGVSLVRDDDSAAGPPVASGPTAGTAVDGSVAPEVLAPTDLATSAVGDAVSLTWVDNTDGSAFHLVYVYEPGVPEPQPLVADAGVSSLTLVGLDPAAPACFRVNAAIGFSDTVGAVETADSEPLCVNGAVPAD
jgi:serine/threonine protein kinase